jgi:hypothetical protein
MRKYDRVMLSITSCLDVSRFGGLRVSILKSTIITQVLRIYLARWLTFNKITRALQTEKNQSKLLRTSIFQSKHINIDQFSQLCVNCEFNLPV